MIQFSGIGSCPEFRFRVPKISRTCSPVLIEGHALQCGFPRGLQASRQDLSCRSRRFPSLFVLASGAPIPCQPYQALRALLLWHPGARKTARKLSRCKIRRRQRGEATCESSDRSGRISRAPSPSARTTSMSEPMLGLASREGVTSPRARRASPPEASCGVAERFGRFGRPELERKRTRLSSRVHHCCAAARGAYNQRGGLKCRAKRNCRRRW